MSRFLPLYDPRWLLLAAAAVLAFALPILTQVRRLGADVLEDTSTLVVSHVGFLAFAFIGYRFTGLRGGLGLAVLWGVLSVTVHFLGVFFTPRPDPSSRVASSESPARPTTSTSGLLHRQLQLEEGWNLISIPLRLLEEEARKVLGERAHFWAWDATERSYYRPEHLTPGMALWIHSPERRDLVFYGYAPATGRRRFPRGWNLVGPTKRMATPERREVKGVWTFEGGRTLPVQQLLLGRGYWIYVEEDVDLAV